MANEFQHKTVGTAMTQAEYEATDGTGHIFASQAAGDIAYATSTTVLSRLGIGAANTILTSSGTAPQWSATLATTTIADDGLLKIGADGDSVIVNRSTSLSADAELSNVIEGTSDHLGVAANSLIISNITNDGDILFAVSDGGNSKGLLKLDGANGRVVIHGGDVLVSGSQKIYFNDVGGEYIYGNGSTLVVAGGSEIDITATLMDINGIVQISGTTYINDTANGDVTTGLTINQGAADDTIFALKSSDINHPFTGVQEADTYFAIKKEHGSYGGPALLFFSDNDRNAADFEFRLGDSTPTEPVMKLDMRKTDGSTADSPLTANEGGLKTAVDATSAPDDSSELMLIESDGYRLLHLFRGGGSSGWSAAAGYETVIKAGYRAAHGEAANVLVLSGGQATPTTTNNIAGGNIVLRGGQGKGSGTSGDFIFQGIAAGSSGSNLNATYADKFKVDSGTGDVTGVHGTYHESSDQRVKENIIDSAYGLADILQMRPVKFNFVDGYGTDNETRVGFLAQDIQAIIPEAVHEGDGSFGDIQNILAIQERQLIPVIVKAIQELNQKLDAKE